VPPVLGSVSTSRRANAFAESLEEPRLDEAPAERTPTGQDAPADTAEQAALLCVAEGPRALPRPELSADTKTVHRAQLIAAMETAYGGGTDGERVPEQRATRGAHRAAAAHAVARFRPQSRLTKGLAAGGLTLGVAAGAFGGAAAASTNALPGDTLYGLKRGMEDLRLDLAGGKADRGRVYLDNASTRLNEARRLMERQKAGDLDDDQLAEVRRTLASMHTDASKGHLLLSEAYRSNGSIGPLRTLSAFNDKSSGTWSELRDRLPFQLHDVSDDVTSLLEAIEDDLEPLQSLLPSDDAGTSARPDGNGPAFQPPTGTPEEGHHGSPSAPATSASPEPEPEPEPERVSPSEEQPPEEGLLGGTGLLDPDSDLISGEEPLPEGAYDTIETPEPDVTIPPLIDDLLPGLGLDIRQTD
jgi:hypothetical protein